MDYSFFPASLSAVAILGIRKKRIWGPIVAIWASLAWIVYGGLTDQIGIVFSEMIFACLYTATMLEWIRE